MLFYNYREAEIEGVRKPRELVVGEREKRTTLRKKLKINYFF